MFAVRRRKAEGLCCEPGGHGHRLRVERRTQQHCIECVFQLGPCTITRWPQRSSPHGGDLLLVVGVGEQNSLLTAESWCCRASHAARSAPWLSRARSSRPTGPSTQRSCLQSSCSWPGGGSRRPQRPRPACGRQTSFLNIHARMTHATNLYSVIILFSLIYIKQRLQPSTVYSAIQSPSVILASVRYSTDQIGGSTCARPGSC